ncbi:MAG: hypothetical protein ACRD6N_07565 [Pyrinomonadaceae bacterium]
MTQNDKSGLLSKALHAGEKVAQVGVEATRLKAAASHAVEDAMTEARRLAKRGRYAAEDLIDETTHQIKRQPLRAVAITFAVALLVGLLAGFLAGRSSRE